MIRALGRELVKVNFLLLITVRPIILRASVFFIFFSTVKKAFQLKFRFQPDFNFSDTPSNLMYAWLTGDATQGHLGLDPVSSCIEPQWPRQKRSRGTLA